MKKILLTFLIILSVFIIYLTTIDNAPTIPSDTTILACIDKTTPAVTILINDIVILKFLE